jgi:hypothetical protein
MYARLCRIIYLDGVEDDLFVKRGGGDHQPSQGSSRLPKSSLPSLQPSQEGQVPVGMSRKMTAISGPLHSFSFPSKPVKSLFQCSVVARGLLLATSVLATSMASQIY